MVGRTRVSRGGDRSGNRKRRPLGLLVALVMVASLAMPVGVASAAIGASGNPLTTAAPDLRTVAVVNVPAEIARFCFDQPVANFAGNAGDFRLAGYNSAIQTTGTSIGTVPGEANCLDVEFANALVELTQYTVGTVQPGAVTNASASNGNVESAAALTNINLGPGGLAGRTSAPDLTGATVAGNDVLFNFDEKLLSTSCTNPALFAMWDNADPTPNRTVGILCSVDPGSSTARVTFPSTANAARFVATQGAVTDPAMEANPIGVSPLAGITCMPGSTNCTADLTAVSRVSDVDVDYTFDKGDPVAPHSTTCDSTKFFIYEDDAAAYSGTCNVQSSTANSTVVRVTFATAGWSAFETPTAAVGPNAIGGGGGLIATDGARQLAVSREASGFTDAPDLENAEFDTGFNRVTFDFDENVLDASVTAGNLCLVNADDVESCTGTKVATNGDKVVMQFGAPEVNTAVGALIKDTSLTDFPGNANLEASVGRGPAPSAGTVQFSSPTFSVNENGGSATISVTRTGGSSGPASVTCSTSNGTASNADYTNVSQPLSWSDGDSSTKSCNVPITDDVLGEGNETVNLSLSGATGAALGSPSAATLTIVDNDSTGALSFSATTYSVGEGAGTALITVQRTGGTSGTATVQYSTSNGSATAGADYTSTNGTLTFGNGVSSQTFTVPITQDALVEGNETVNLSIFSPGGGASLTNPTTAILTIVDDDTNLPGTLALASSTHTVAEGAGSQTITVNRTGGATGTVTVNYATSNGTATSGSDYTATAGSLSFGPGETTKSFSVPILNDTADESAESFNVSLSGPTGGAVLGAPSSGSVTITDDDLPEPGVVESGISIKYKNRSNRFKGRVSTPTAGSAEIAAVCRDNRQVLLHKLNRGQRGQDFTGANGRWSIFKNRANGGWFAVVRATGPRTLSDGSQVICARGESSIIFP